MSSDVQRVRETENFLHGLAPRTDDPPTAGCPTCKAPLIATLAFQGAEFYCLECGNTCGWLSPYRLNAAEVKDRMEALQAEWDEHVGGKIMPRSVFWRMGCEQCGGDGKPRPEQGHWEHVTEEEIEADKEARAWLKQRVRL